MAITLRPITPDNWELCINLKTTDEQQRFVAANLYSLARSLRSAERKSDDPSC